jgi:hypothetical protein
MAISDFAPLNPGYVAKVKDERDYSVLRADFQFSGETAGDLFARRKAAGRLLRVR